MVKKRSMEEFWTGWICLVLGIVFIFSAHRMDPDIAAIPTCFGVVGVLSGLVCLVSWLGKRD